MSDDPTQAQHSGGTQPALETWSNKLAGYLTGLPDTVQKVSSRQVKKDLQADRLATSTWKRVVKAGLAKQDHASKDIGAMVLFALEGQSLARQSANRYGFQNESVA